MKLPQKVAFSIYMFKELLSLVRNLANQGHFEVDLYTGILLITSLLLKSQIVYLVM